MIKYHFSSEKHLSRDTVDLEKERNMKKIHMLCIATHTILIVSSIQFSIGFDDVISYKTFYFSNM